MRNFLKSFDQFGVPLTQSVNKDEPFFRSVAGGLVTFMIYSASLSYAVYVIILWSTGEFSPKISTTMKVKNFAGSNMDFNLVTMGFWMYSDKLLDPFKAQGNILTPLIFSTTDNGGNTTTSILNDNAEDLTDYGVQKINPNFELTFAADPVTGLTYVTSDMYLLLVRCESKYMKEGQYCADEETIDAFFQQPLNNIMIYLEYTNLNPITKEQEHKSDIIFVQIEDISCYSHTLKLTTTEYEIRDTFMPGQSKYQTHVDGSKSQGQTSSTQYCKKAYDADAYIVLYIFVDSLQTKALYEYPNGGDVLANIGSIVSILFMAKHIIIALNSYFLQETIISQLYEYYYPEFNKIIVKCNWRRQIQSVQLNGKSIDITAFQRFESRLRDMMLSKISLTNMIYELSRLEFIVRSIISKENLRKCHGVGIKVRLKELMHAKAQIDIELESSSIRQNQGQNSQVLVDEDCNVLSLDHRQHYRQNTIEVEPEPNNFYDINQIII